MLLGHITACTPVTSSSNDHHGGVAARVSRSTTEAKGPGQRLGGPFDWRPMRWVIMNAFI